MKEKLILTNDYVWIEFILAGVSVKWMLDTGYPDPHYRIRIGYNTGDMDSSFLLTKEPIHIHSEFQMLSKVLGEFTNHRQFIDTAEGEDCNYSIVAYPTKYHECKVFFNLGLDLLFPRGECYSTTGEIAVLVESGWGTLQLFAWKLQAAELTSMLENFEELLVEYPDCGLEEVRDLYREKHRKVSLVLENWNEKEIPEFEATPVIRFAFPKYDRKQWELWLEIKRKEREMRIQNRLREESDIENKGDTE